MLIRLNGSNHPELGYADLTECCENPSEGGMDKVEFLDEEELELRRGRRAKEK